jgi:hypothetical protein
VRLQVGRPDAAVLDLEKAMEEADDVAFAYHMARAELAQKQQTKALSTWEGALAAGLETERLHPIEREEFQRFKKQIESLKQVAER